MRKLRMYLMGLVTIMLIECISIRVLDYKNKLIADKLKQSTNSEEKAKEFNMESIDAFNNVFYIEEVNKVNSNVYLWYNIKGTIEECLNGIDYYVKEGCKIENLKLDFWEEDNISGNIKLSI